MPQPAKPKPKPASKTPSKAPSKATPKAPSTATSTATPKAKAGPTPAASRRRPPPSTPSTRSGAVPAGRPGWVLPAVVVGVVLALLAVAVIATRLGGDGNGGGGLAQTRPVTVAGTALPELPQSGADPAVGMAAPRVTGASFDGRPVELGTPGRPTMVLFVAHWCPHCQREVPLLAPELGRITPAGVQVLTVATDTKKSAPNYPPSKWLAKEGWPSTVLADDTASRAGAAYGLSGFPYFVLVGGDGKVVSRGSGERSVADVQALLQQVAPAGAG